jgi:hypothetical protein
MTEPALGLYYTFKYIGGRVYDPDQYDGEGMFIGRRGSTNVFATVIPKREASTHHIQSVMLTYTDMAYHKIPHPSDKVMMTSDTQYVVMNYIKSERFKDPVPNGRTSPVITLTTDVLLS